MKIKETSQGIGAFQIHCDHCGNETLQTIMHNEIVSEPFPAAYALCRCVICEGIVLRRVTGRWSIPFRASDFLDDSETQVEQLWPEPMYLSVEAPERVRHIYQEACAVRRQSPSSFVVQIRRALEAVANEQGAQGGSLQLRIQWLIQNGRLPPVFGDMSHISRMIGNLGAHDTEKTVTSEDASVVDSFFRATIEYLYVAQAKVAQVRAFMKRGTSTADD